MSKKCLNILVLCLCLLTVQVGSLVAMPMSAEHCHSMISEHSMMAEQSMDVEHVMADMPDGQHDCCQDGSHLALNKCCEGECDCSPNALSFPTVMHDGYKAFQPANASSFPPIYIGLHQPDINNKKRPPRLPLV